jgi:hypothetical protein
VLPVQPAQTLVPIQTAATQMMEPPQAYAPPQAYQAPAHVTPGIPAYQPATQAMRLPAQPPGAGALDVPLSAIAPTISPDAGFVAPQGVHAWNMSPQGPPSQHQPALHGGDDLRNRPEYVAATAAYQAAADFINPGVGPGSLPAPRGTPPHMAAAPERRSRQRTASTTTPPPRGSALGTLAILLLCAVAAVGGFFLVQHLM